MKSEFTQLPTEDPLALLKSKWASKKDTRGDEHIQQAEHGRSYRMSITYATLGDVGFTPRTLPPVVIYMSHPPAELPKVGSPHPKRLGHYVVNVQLDSITIK